MWFYLILNDNLFFTSIPSPFKISFTSDIYIVSSVALQVAFNLSGAAVVDSLNER